MFRIMGLCLGMGLPVIKINILKLHTKALLKKIEFNVTKNLCLTDDTHTVFMILFYWFSLSLHNVKKQNKTG